MRVVVGKVDEIPPGERRRVSANGRDIVVFNVDGAFYALRDVCPHQGAQLSCGHVVGSVTSTGPGSYVYAADRPVVKCPWHGWEFELATGQSWCDPAKLRVRRYPVEIESGAEVGEGGREPGPYVAETIPVSVEERYVVIDA
jgi:nitrite reductase/ring-hydroxylating ferredoxin subunit